MLLEQVTPEVVRWLVFQRSVKHGCRLHQEVIVPRQLKASILCAVVAVIFVALQIAFRVHTGMAGVFVMGVAGGLLIGNEMARAPRSEASA